MLPASIVSIILETCADGTSKWLTFSAVSDTASEYFHVSESAINWLSTGFLFAFVVVSP